MTVTAIGHNGTAGGTSTVTVTGVTVPAGALICVLVEEGLTTTLGTISDGSSNSYVGISLKQNNNNGGTSGTGNIYYVKNSAALNNATITYTKAGSGSACISALYATGIDTVNPLDTAVTATAAGTGTSPSVTSGTPSQAGELFISGVTWPGATGDAFTQDSGHNWVAPFTYEHTVSFSNCAGGNQVNSGTGTITFAPTIPSHGWAAFVVGFKQASVQMQSAMVMP